MTSGHERQNGEADETDTYNVIAVSFEPDDNAYAALTALKELDDQGRLRVEAAVVVVRDADGQVTEKERAGSFDHVGTASGGLLGLMLGVFGGQVGVLVGATSGLLVGSRFDLDEIDRTESVLSKVSAMVRPDRTALLAQVTEPEGPEEVDAAMAQLGGTVLRRPVADVEAEIAATDKARFEAQLKATKQRARARREHSKEQGPASRASARYGIDTELGAERIRNNGPETTAQSEIGVKEA